MFNYCTYVRKTYLEPVAEWSEFEKVEFIQSQVTVKLPFELPLDANSVLYPEFVDFSRMHFAGWVPMALSEEYADECQP